MKNKKVLIGIIVIILIIVGIVTGIVIANMPKEKPEEVLNKYNITREELALYNNLDDLKIGSKLIIPTSINEKNA